MLRVVKAAGWQVAERLHTASHGFTPFVFRRAHCFEGPSTGCRALAKAQGESADQKPKSSSAGIQTPSNTKVSPNGPNEHRKTNM